MPQPEEISVAVLRAELNARLRGMQRALVLKHLWRGLLESVPISASVLIVSLIGLRLPLLSALEISLAAAAIWVLVRLSIGYPDLLFSARRFDLHFGTNSRVTNAWELAEKNADSEFALYAIRDGIAVLSGKNFSERFSVEKPDFSWKLFLLPLLGGVLAFGIRFWPGNNGFVKPGGNGSDVRGVAAPAGAATETAQPRQAASIPETGNETLSAEETGKDSKGNAWKRNSPGLAFFRRGGNGNAGTDELSASSSKPSEKKTGDDSSRSSEPSTGKAGSDQSSAEADAWSESEAARSPAQVLTGKHGTGFDKKPQAKRQKQVRHNSESALNGAQPLLADNSPPASRELGEGEKEGDGDKNTGRGGPNGEKKSRGTASMLPTVPLPDLINGMLAPGEEISLPDSSALPQVSGASQGVRIAAHGAEPAVQENFLPRSWRKGAEPSAGNVSEK